MGSDCTLCPLHQTAETVCIPGRGPMASRLLILGMAPGKYEDRMGECFVGPSGRLLDEVLDALGLTARRTNVVRCRPPSPNPKKDNRDPKVLEIQACLPYLREEILAMPSLQVIVALGNIPLRALGLKGRAVGTVAGVPIQATVFGRELTVVGMLHPAAVLRRQSSRPQWEAHWHTVRRVVDDTAGEIDLLTDGLFPSMEIFEDHFPAVPEGATEYVLDLETTGLDPRRHAITACGWSLPDGTTKAGMVRRPEDLQRVREAFSRPGARITVQHCPMEGGYAEEFLHVPEWEKTRQVTDTRLLALRADPGSPAGLDTLTASYLPELAGFKAQTESILLDVTWAEVPARPLLRRCALDCFATGKLKGILSAKLSPEELALHDEDVRSALSVSRMSRRGLVLNVPEIEDRQRDTRKAMDGAQKAATALLGQDVSLGSSQQVGAVLVDLMPSELASRLPRTDTGQPSTEEVVLRLLRMEYEAQGWTTDPVYLFLGHLLEYRKAEKVSGTYLAGYMKRMDGDGRLRAELWWPGTITWRPSSNDPNVLNIPRGDVRSIVGAPPGYVLLEADYGQIELRIAAALSRDPVFLRNFIQGIDGHTHLAHRAFGIPMEEVTKEQRYTAKTTNFGTIYGGSPKVLWEQFIKDGFEILLKDVDHLHSVFWGEHVPLFTWIEGRKEAARRGEPAHAPEGAYRWTLEQILPRSNHKMEDALREIVNLPIQSVPPRLVSRAILEIEDQAPWIEPVLHTYDGGVFYVPQEQVQEAARIVHAAFSRQGGVEGWWAGIPLPVDVKAGPDWGHMKEIKL